MRKIIAYSQASAAVAAAVFVHVASSWPLALVLVSLTTTNLATSDFHLPLAVHCTTTDQTSVVPFSMSSRMCKFTKSKCLQLDMTSIRTIVAPGTTYLSKIRQRDRLFPKGELLIFCTIRSNCTPAQFGFLPISLSCRSGNRLDRAEIIGRRFNPCTTTSSANIRLQQVDTVFDRCLLYKRLSVASS